MSKYQEMLTAWNDEVLAVADGGYYRQERRARNWVIEHVMPVWRIAIAADADEDMVDDRMGLTPTMVQILHLFGRAMIGVGAKGTKAPRFRARCPERPDNETDSPVCYSAISQPSIARLIGKSASAVKRGLHAFRHATNEMRTHNLVNVISIECGIILDGMFTPQTSFAFAYADYDKGNSYALQHRVEQGAFAARQQEVCKMAVREKFGGSLVLFGATPKTGTDDK